MRTTLRAHVSLRPGRRRVVMAVLLLLLTVAGLATQAGGRGRRLAGEWLTCLLSGRAPAGTPPGADGVPAPVLQTLGEPGLDATTGNWSAAGLDRLPGVTVAVLDSGVDAGHNALSAAVLPGLDLINLCGDAHSDAFGHGTQVAGVIAGTGSGIAPGVLILPIRTSPWPGVQLRIANAAAIVLAAGNGADVINISSSSNSGRESVMEHAAIRYAVRRGAVVVASAGNDAAVPARYPAAYPEVISVTAADADGGLAAWAAWKGGIDVAAPGAQVVTTVAGGGYVRASGTSFAAPYVAGVVARMKAADPRLTPAEIERILVDTARPPDGSRGKSQRLPAVDPAAALAAVSGPSKGIDRLVDDAHPAGEFVAPPAEAPAA